MEENAAGAATVPAIAGDRSRRFVRIVRGIYTLALLGATFNHARIVLAHGLDWDYGGLPGFVTRFWTALTSSTRSPCCCCGQRRAPAWAPPRQSWWPT